jgi:hypothetical protein
MAGTRGEDAAGLCMLPAGSVTAPALRGLSRFAEARGVPAGREFLLDYDVIEAFCVAGLAGRACSTRGTYRSALYRLAMAAHGPPGQRATAFPGSRAPAPYSPAERAVLAALTAAQRDAARSVGDPLCPRGDLNTPTGEIFPDRGRTLLRGHARDRPALEHHANLVAADRGLGRHRRHERPDRGREHLDQADQANRARLSQRTSLPRPYPPDQRRPTCSVNSYLNAPDHAELRRVGIPGPAPPDGPRADGAGRGGAVGAALVAHAPASAATRSAGRLRGRAVPPRPRRGARAPRNLSAEPKVVSSRRG